MSEERDFEGDPLYGPDSPQAFSGDSRSWNPPAAQRPRFTEQPQAPAPSDETSAALHHNEQIYTPEDHLMYSAYDPDLGRKVSEKLNRYAEFNRKQQRARENMYGVEIAAQYEYGYTPDEVREEYQNRIKDYVYETDGHSTPESSESAESDPGAPPISEKYESRRQSKVSGMDDCAVQEEAWKSSEGNSWKNERAVRENQESF